MTKKIIDIQLTDEDIWTVLENSLKTSTLLLHWQQYRTIKHGTDGMKRNET